MSENVSFGRRRRRTYKRRFDWAEARARYAAGESGTRLAKEYGVNKEAVYRVLKLPEYLVAQATPEQMATLANTWGKDQVPCPQCERPKTREAELCRDCWNAGRIGEVQIKKVPGERRIVLADVEYGRIVRVGKRWGVLVRGANNHRWRIIDFWDGGPEFVPDITVVATAPTHRVFVDGEEETPEEIAA